MAEIQQLPKKQRETWQKQLFLALFFPFFYLLPHGQVKALFYVPIKSKSGKRATRAWPCLNHLGCDTWDMKKSVFYPKEYSQFHCLNLHISLYRLFIAFIQCILSSEWLWNSYCSSVCSCPQHVVEWPRRQVGLKQLFMLSRGDRFDSVMIQSNCGE